MHSVFSTATLLAALAATAVQAHMEMSFPPPLRSKFNSFATTKDFDMTSPLSASGANYPCKGYLSDLGSPGGQSVVTFTPGQKSNMTIVGGANHNGGSCQASLSYDKGKTFTVIQSIIGECPQQGTSSFDFTIPDDAPAGDAVFAWTWSNKVGNAEMYMNCASVTIGGAKNKIRGMPRPRAAVAFSSRPPVFVSNVGNGCKTENMVVDYPNPGPDVTRNGQATAPSCDGGAGKGAAGGSGNGGGAASSGGAGSGQPASSANGGGNNGAPATSAAATSAPAATTTAAAQPTAPAGGNSGSSTPGGVFIPKPSASGGAGSAAPTAPAASPSTTPAASGTAAPAVPAQPSAAPTGSPAPGAGGGQASGQLSGKCDNEGAYNCMGGSAFQRCASGTWSVPIPMAPGTTCTAGQSNNLSVTKRKFRRGGARKA